MTTAVEEFREDGVALLSAQMVRVKRRINSLAVRRNWRSPSSGLLNRCGPGTVDKSRAFLLQQSSHFLVPWCAACRVASLTLLPLVRNFGGVGGGSAGFGDRRVDAIVDQKSEGLVVRLATILALAEAGRRN